MNETPNGMKREDKSGKINFLDYTTPENEMRYGRHMLKGAIKHGSGNWKKGAYGLQHWCESAERHLKAMWFIAQGLPVPPELESEPGEDHAAALRFNAEGFMNEQNQQHETK